MQQVHEIRMDCDNDVLLLKVDAARRHAARAIACHTGRHSCFFQRYEDGGWQQRRAGLERPEVDLQIGRVDAATEDAPTTRWRAWPR